MNNKKTQQPSTLSQEELVTEYSKEELASLYL